MSDDVREYVRKAQDAEIRGEKEAAAQWITKASALYRQAGKTLRAEQMVRHAERLMAGILRAPVPRVANDVAADLIGQTEGEAAFDALLQRGVKKILLLGPTGVGKSYFLKGLIQSRKAIFLQPWNTAPTSISALAADERVIIDDPLSWPLSQAIETIHQLEEMGVCQILALRSVAPIEPSYPMVAAGQTQVHGIYGLDAVAKAVGVHVPDPWLHRVDGVVTFRNLSQPEWAQVARRLISLRKGLQVSEPHLEFLAHRTTLSAFGGHGLESEILQLPSVNFQ